MYLNVNCNYFDTKASLITFSLLNVMTNGTTMLMLKIFLFFKFCSGPRAASCGIYLSANSFFFSRASSQFIPSVNLNEILTAVLLKHGYRYH